MYYKEVRMKKKALAMVLTGVMAASMLAGCGSSGTKEDTAKASSEEAGT